MTDDFETVIPKRYAGLVGLGLFFTWGTALVTWIHLWNSSALFMQSLGLVGAVLTSASGTAIALYTNDIELQLKKIHESNKQSAEAARYWQDQAQRAISILDSRSAKD